MTDEDEEERDRIYAEWQALVKASEFRVGSLHQRPVTQGDVINDFRGKMWVFERISALPTQGKSGKVLVHDVDKPHNRAEFYPSVFNGRIYTPGDLDA